MSIDPRLRLSGRDYALIALVCLAWAGNFLTSKLALREFPPFEFSALRLALLSLLLACFNPWSLAVAGGALVAIVALNWGLFSFFMRTRGPWFALRCVPLHLLYFLYSGASLALFQLAALFGVELKDGNTTR